MNALSMLGIYFLIVNLLGFALMGLDKRKARKHQWRISEATLFWFALIGGSIGTLIGMYFFRHKTRHRVFVVGIPIILILQFIIAGILLKLPVTYIIL